MVLTCLTQICYAQSDTLSLIHNDYERSYSTKHSIYTDPTLMLLKSYVMIYEYRFNSRNSLTFGFWYNKGTETYPKKIQYPGYSLNYYTILGYRRYLWKGLHVEYQLYPGYSKFYEENKNRYFNSFAIFNEFRFGYKFELKVFKTPILANFQWPIGWIIYESNEPETFKKIRKQDPVFYIFYPNIYLGYRF